MNRLAYNSLKRVVLQIADDLDNGRCRNVKPSFLRSAAKSLDSMRKAAIGEEERSFDEACSDVGIGRTQMQRYIHSGLMPRPTPADYHKVVFSEKHIEELINYRNKQ